MGQYLVELDDGRKFEVEADAPPTESDVMGYLGVDQAVDEPQVPSEPLFDLSDTLAATGQALGGLTTTTPHAYRQLAEGMGNPWKRSPEYRASQQAMSQYAQELEAANKAAQESGDISVLSRGMRGAGQSLGFSAGAMGSSLVGGSAVGTAGRYIGSLAGPEGAAAGEIAGRGIGALGASYGAAYRMAGAQFLDDAREAIDAKFQRLHNRLPTEEEQEEAYQELLPLAEAFGHAEAGPEAIGNLALGVGGKYVLGLGRKKIAQLADSALAKVLKKTAAGTAAAATEFGGETVTEVEQNRIDEQARAAIAGEAPPEQPPRSVEEYVKAFGDIAPTTAATMALLGGAGVVAKGAQRLMTPPAQPTQESEEPMVLGRTVQQVLDEADAVSARAVVQAEEAGSPLLAQAIAEQTAVPVPEVQAEEALVAPTSIADSPSPNVPPRATENIQPRPQRNGRDTSARDAWDEQYGGMRKGGRTHNDDGTPYQPTVFDEVMPNILAARSQMTDEEANERLGDWSETRLATSVKTLLNAGWTWDAENQRWRQPEGNPIPNERPIDAILRLQGKNQEVAPSTAPTVTPAAPAAPAAPAPAPKRSAAEKALGLPAGALAGQSIAPKTAEAPLVVPSAEVPAIQEPELSEGAQRNQDLIAQAAATNAGRAPVSANEYIQKAAAAPQSNLPPVTLQEGEAEVQAAPERAVEQNPVAAMAAQAAAKARGEVKEVSAPSAEVPAIQEPDRLTTLREMRDLGGMPENEARALLEKDAGKRARIMSVLSRVSKAREVDHILQNARRAYENQATPEDAAPEVVQISEGAEARVGGTTVGRVTTGPVDVETARRMFPDQVRTGDEVRRVQGIDLDEKQRGKGIGKQLYVAAMDQAPDAWYYNSQATKEAARALRSLERYGLIELHVRQERDGEFGPHIKRLTEEGRKYAQNLAGKELPEAAAPATAENIADRINASSLSPATTYPSLVQDIKSLTEGKPARLQEVADALFDQPMPRPTAEKIARRLLDENAAEREATASRDRRVVREMIGEEENQRGGEAPVSDDRAPLEKGEFVAWQDENGAMQEGVLTKISAGRNGQGEPMSEVTLETSEVVQVPRRELRPMASQRISEAKRVRMNALKSLYGHLGTVVSVGVSAVDGINAMTSLQNEVPGVQKAWIGTREEFLADERLGKAFPGILNVLKNPGGDTIEGLFDAGRVFVFTDNVGVYEGDVRSAKEQSEITGEVVTPHQAAVQRVVLHEGLAHRGFYALDKDTRRALFQWGAQNIYETEMDEVNDLYGFSFRAALDEVAKTEGFKDADAMEEKVGRAAIIQKATEKGLFEKHDWRVNERSREWIMEEILAKKIERLKAPPKSGPLKALWDILVSLWRKLTGSVQEVTLKDIQDVAKVLRTALELSENNVETRNGMPIRVEVAKGSLRPRFTSPLDATLSDTAKALRLMRDGPPATPVDLQQAYATAVRGKSSAMVSLDDLFAAAKASAPSLTEAEFGQQVQNLYNDNGAYVESAESPAVMKQSADRYNVRSAQGIPATYVMILETGRPMASMRPDARDAEYLAAVEAGDMEKASGAAPVPDGLQDKKNPLAGLKALFGPRMSGHVADGSLAEEVLSDSQALQRGYPEEFATISIKENSLGRLSRSGTGVRQNTWEHIGDLYHRAGSVTDYRNMRSKVETFLREFKGGINGMLVNQAKSNAIYTLTTQKYGRDYTREQFREVENSPEGKKAIEEEGRKLRFMDAAFASMYERMQAFTPLQAMGRNMAIAFGLRRYDIARQLGEAILSTIEPNNDAVVTAGFNSAGVNNLKKSDNQTKEQFDLLLKTGETIEKEPLRSIDVFSQISDRITDEELLSPITLVKEQRAGLEQRFGPSPDIRYSLADKDAEYLDAVESGDMEKAQRMVDEAAKKAGYNVGKAFHGTRSKGFTVFKTRDLGHHFGLSEDQVFGEYGRFSNTPREQVRLIKAYLDIKNPLELFDRGSWDGWLTIREVNEKIGTSLSEQTATAADIQKAIKDAGYDGVEYDNLHEGEEGSRAVIAFDPSQIKSADPVTYDDAGNVIPLSQRFQTTSPDIRFSLRPDAARRLNRAVWEAQEASGPIKDSEQTPLKDFPVHSFAQQSGESRTNVAIQVVDELLKSGVPVNGLVDAMNSYELHRQLGIERDPDMLGILLAEAMRRGDPNAFRAYQVARERAGRALGTGAILHKDPRFQHLFLLEGMKDGQVQQARDIQNANAPMTADEVKRLDAEAGRTAAAEDAGAVQDALEEDLLEIGEKGLSPKERTLWEKAKYLVARIGYLLKLGSGDAKPSLRFEFPDSEKQALSKLSADERQKELQKTRAELRATLGELLGQRKPRKAAGGVETIEGDLTTRAVADMVQRMQERLNIPVDTATAIDALTTTGNLKGQFENFISDSLISKVRSVMTPKQAPVKNLNSVIRQITSILADNLNLPKAQTAKESLGERALDTFGRVRSNEQMIREAWERSREGIRSYLAKRAVEGKEGLTDEEAAEIEEAVDAQLDAIASSVPARMWARGQAYSLIRDALEGSKFDTNEDILRDPQTALKTVQDRLNSEVSKIGNVDPARWDSDQAYIVAAFNSLVADLKERKAKAEARRAGKTRSGLMTGSDKKILTSLIEQARKRSGDKAPLLPDSATWTKIFSGSPQSQEAKAKEMLDYMKADPLLSNLTAAEQQQLADMFARRWEQKRKELLEAKVASILKARNATPKGKNAAKDAVPKFIQAINRGELTNDVIAEEIAEKFGFEKLTEGEKKTLERLSRELQEPNLPQHEKTAKIDEMAQIIARKTNMSKAEILSAWWVTSVLSGPRTAFTIGLAASNGAFEVLGHAVSTVLNANWNGRRAEGIAAAGQALKNYFKSWPRAIQLAWQYVLTGDKKLLSAMDPAYSQFFETGRNNPLSVGWRLSQSKNPVARATGRFMHFFEKLLSALDLFTATTTRHGMLPISYYLNQKTYDKARVANETDLANYRKKVIDLWWGGKEPTTGAEQALVTRQSINMMEEQLAKYANVLEDAGFAAAQAAMTLTPEGLGGQFYQAVRSVANKAERSAEKAVREAERLDGKDHGPIERNTRKALAYLYRFLAYQMLNVAGLRFARFAGNKLNQSLGFIPGLGLLRKFEKDYAGPMKNQAIMRNQAIGAMMAMVGYNVLKAIGDEPDDDKRGWGIEGSWKNLTPDQIKQLQAAGRKQYTIHIGDMSFNYANWPVSSVLAAIGTMADRIKYSPDKWKETSALDKIATGAWAASTATMDASSLSQLAEVFGSNIHTRDPVEASAKWASRVFGNYAGGMIPRVFKDADLILDGKMGKYDGWENFGKEIPVYRRYVGGPLLDIFGKQVEVSRTPWSREFQVQPPEREYRLLGQLNSNDLWLAPANPGGRRVGRGKRSREMTDAEQKRYVTLVGDGYRKVVLKFGDRLAKMDREEAKDLLGKLTAQVRDRAERQAVTQQ